MNEDERPKLIVNEPSGKGLLLPKQFQGGQPTDEKGKCIPCRGTGAIFHGIQIINPVCTGGRIISVEKTEQDWKPCRCYLGQFWRSFHPLNIQARLIYPGRPWHKDVIEALEREKSRIVQEAGGSYAPHQDTFLSDLDTLRGVRTINHTATQE